MNQPFIIYSMIYFLVFSCFVFKTKEAVAAGITIEHLFSSYLGNESANFVKYHMKRICFTVFIHSIIPAGYVIGLYFFKLHIGLILYAGWSSWLYLCALGFSLPILACLIVFYWFINDWKNHPVSKALARFNVRTPSGDTSALEQINNEINSSEKICVHCGATKKTIVTFSWIIAVSSYGVRFAQQIYSELLVDNADTYAISQFGNSSEDVNSFNSTSMVQFINIKVTCTKNPRPFSMRMNALDFKEVKRMVRCPIIISEHVTFYRTKIDQFLDVFRETVQKNPVHVDTSEMEPCYGCVTELSNVKLIKHCGSGNDIPIVEIGHDGVNITVEKCEPCRCKPMWCIDCVGRWFASRQNQRVTRNWLSSKCKCPVCRSSFCVLDVCLVVNSE